MVFSITEAMTAAHHARNDAARVRVAERELKLREELARSGQHQQLREYEDRKAKEVAEATRNETFNRLSAMYLGGQRSSPLSNPQSGQYRNLLTDLPPPSGMPISSAPGATAPQPINHLASPPLPPAGSASVPVSSITPGMSTATPRGSSLNLGNLNRDELMQAMIAADPKRAQEIQSWGDEQWRNEALSDYRKAEQILNSTNPKLLAERLTPEIMEDLAEDGYSWQTLNDDHVRTLMRSFMSELSPLAGIDMNAQSLEMVVGRDGKPVLLPRSQAVGRQPYQKDGSPTSYDEFVLAQQDPEFSKFLRERGGKGIKFTMPDGSVVEIGGNEGGIGADDLTAPTRNKLQESLVQASDELDRLNTIGESFDPKFLTVQGRALGAGLKLKDITGGLFGQMTPEERDYLRRYSAFLADTTKNLSLILNRLSGAAISPAEGERLKKGIPNTDDSPTQFHAKYTSAVKDVTRATMRANWALKNGIGVRSVEQLAQVMPLDAIDQVFEQRANQIWQGLGGTPETKQPAIQHAKQEFGLAR